MLFNPNATLTVIRFDERHSCHVMDDALLDPEALVQFAAERRTEFRRVEADPYPGQSLAPPPAVTRELGQLFTTRLRGAFDARRLLQTHCRLSMVTLAPTALRPEQWLCHRDGESLGPRHGRQASLLYLFRDESLGGTRFYEPVRSDADTARIFDDARRLAPQEFSVRYGVKPGYIGDSTDFFMCVGAVPARWNRLVFYDGGTLHSGDIPHPERLSEDPRSGRLTLNGFFTSRRNVA